MLRLGIELRLNPAFGQPSGFNSKPPPRPTSASTSLSRTISLSPNRLPLQASGTISASPRQPASCLLLRPLAPAYLPARCDGAGARPCRVMHVYLSLSRLPCASFSPTFPARLLPLALLQQHHHPRPAPFGPDSRRRCCVWQTCMLRPPQAPPFEHARRCTTPLLHARPNPYCMPLSYCAQSSFPLNSTACVPAPCVYAVLYSGSSSRRLTGQPRLGRKTLRLHLGPLSEGASAGADARTRHAALATAPPRRVRTAPSFRMLSCWSARALLALVSFSAGQPAPVVQERRSP